MIEDPRAERTLAVAEAVSQMLRARGIAHAIIGAVAMAVYGHARQTSDFDFGTCTDPFTSLREATRDLESVHGWHVEFVTPDSEDPLGGVITITGEDFDPVQIVNFLNPFSTGASALFHEALDRTGSTKESGFIPIGLPYLIALKLYAGGIFSRADVAALLAANPELDRAELADVCNRFGLKGELERLLADINEGA